MDAVTEVRAWGGGQIDSDGHGDVTFSVRRGRWHADVFTDTVQLSWEPATDRGRAWLLVRGNAFAAEMFLSPWTAGAPDPTRALWASAGAIEGGGVRYLGGGAYVGAQAAAKVYGFFARDETTIEVPPVRPIAGVDLLAGVWKPEIDAKLEAGILGPVASPHLRAHVLWTPIWIVAPLVEARVGAAEGTDALTKTRLGGLVPYAVPLAGAAWAEWWVEDYAAVRIGGMAGPAWLRAGLAADGAVWTEAEAGGDGVGVGFVALVKARWRQAYVDLRGGYAPWIPRAEGVGRASLFFRVGLDWTQVRHSGVRTPDPL